MLEDLEVYVKKSIQEFSHQSSLYMSNDGNLLNKWNITSCVLVEVKHHK